MNNTVSLLEFAGSDDSHARSAWTSTQTDVVKNRERIPKLLKMLAEEGHHTPFEKSFLNFQVVCDQASHIHLLKHRIGTSINGESARYKEIKSDKYYVPEDCPEMVDDLIRYTEEGLALYHKWCEALTEKHGRNRAKEVSRFFRSFNTQITLDVSFNFRSFANFYRLRSEKGAQVEIRDIAEKMLTLIKDCKDENGECPYKHTLAAFGL